MALIYAALGVFEERHHADGLRLLSSFDAALRTGSTPDRAAEVFEDAEARQTAIVAARAVRDFEALVGRACCVEPCEVRYLVSPGTYVIAVEIGDRDGFHSAADEALGVAHRLADLLRAMGATRVIAYDRD